MNLTPEQAYILLYSKNPSFEEYAATLQTKSKERGVALPDGSSWLKVYATFQQLVNAGVEKRMSDEGAKNWAIKGFQRYLRTNIKPNDSFMNQVEEVRISRIAPFYINLTRYIGVDEKQFSPSELLEIGVAPQDVRPLLEKLYNPELVDFVMNRLNREPQQGLGDVWKVWLSKKPSGNWMVSVSRSSLRELEDFVHSRPQRRRKGIS